MDRNEQSEMGLQERSSVKDLTRSLDLSGVEIESERIVLRKYEGDWTAEQMAFGEAADALFEAIVIEDGVVIDRWTKGQDRDAPQD